MFAADNFTRDTIVDQLDRYLYAGVGAVLSLGTDPGTLPFQVRADQAAGRRGGSTWLTAGRGIAAPNAGPARRAQSVRLRRHDRRRGPPRRTRTDRQQGRLHQDLGRQ